MCNKGGAAEQRLIAIVVATNKPKSAVVAADADNVFVVIMSDCLLGSYNPFFLGLVESENCACGAIAKPNE